MVAIEFPVCSKLFSLKVKRTSDLRGRNNSEMLARKFKVKNQL